MKKYLPILAVIYSLNLTAQNVNIPDANFKTYLVNNASINTDMDADIQVSEAAAYTGNINVSSLSISDLTGIEAFTALTELECYYNSLTSLNVSANTALTYLDCYSNAITSLDISANTALTYLECGVNALTGLNTSANTALTELYCTSNSISSLDVSANTALTDFNCSGNSLLSLDVSGNTALTSFYCTSNSISSLDLSANTALTKLYCFSNSLTSLNVQNGNNINVTSFYARLNPNLTCIQVDDVAWSTANWTVVNSQIDATASFSLNCGSTIGISEQYNAFSIYPNPASTNITIETTNAKDIYQLQDVTGKVLLSGNVTATKFSLDISALSKGIYLLSLFDGEQQVNRKVVKE